MSLKFFEVPTFPVKSQLATKDASGGYAVWLALILVAFGTAALAAFKNKVSKAPREPSTDDVRPAPRATPGPPSLDFRRLFTPTPSSPPAEDQPPAQDAAPSLLHDRDSEGYLSAAGLVKVDLDCAKDKKDHDQAQAAATSSSSSSLSSSTASDDFILAAGRGDIASLKAMMKKLGNSTKVDEQRDQMGYTAFHCAVQYEQMDAAIYLLNLGADKNSVNKAGQTPMATAAQAGAVTFVDLLAQQAGVALDTKTNEGWTPLTLAAYFGHTAAVVRLCAAGAQQNLPNGMGVSPLMVAIDAGYDETARALAAAGADVNQVDLDGVTPLLRAVKSGNLAMVRTLLDDFHANKDQADECGYTPLHAAVFLRHTAIVECLLEVRLCVG